MGLQERISKFLEYKKITHRDFERITGLSNGALAKMHDGSRESSFNRISKAFPELNMEWLRKDEGEMIRSQFLSISGSNNLSNISNTGDIVNVGNCSKEEIITILKEMQKNQDKILKLLKKHMK